MVGVRRTESEGIARVPTATGGDADLGSGLGSGPTPGTGAMDVDDDSPSWPGATGEERTQEDISASNVSNISPVSWNVSQNVSRSVSNKLSSAKSNLRLAQLLLSYGSVQHRNNIAFNTFSKLD